MAAGPGTDIHRSDARIRSRPVIEHLRRIDAGMRLLAADRDAASVNAVSWRPTGKRSRQDHELRSEVDQCPCRRRPLGMSEAPVDTQLASWASEMRAEASSEDRQTLSIARQESENLGRSAKEEADRVQSEAQTFAAAQAGCTTNADKTKRDTAADAEKAVARAQAFGQDQKDAQSTAAKTVQEAKAYSGTQ